MHGGPYVRGGEWGWHPESQFLASRGYAVLEPEYRGSTGFGIKHYRAGWKQWGLKMQDDIADGAKWAIAEGIVDPQRICIAGASYGGYATLMGLVNDPGLYKCGIDWVGVTDIKLLYDRPLELHSGHDATSYKQYGMPELVGDVGQGRRATGKATSPLRAGGAHHAAAAAGLRRRRHARADLPRQASSTTPSSAPIPTSSGWCTRRKAHGWVVPKNRVDFWGRVEKFLDRNIGKPGARQ